MPLIDGVLNRNSIGAQVVELHKQLAELGAVIKSDEQTAKRFGDSTGAAVREFRRLRELPEGDQVDKSTALLMHVEAAFASPGGRQALRAALAEAAGASANVTDPQALFWLAYRAVGAGDHKLAQKIAERIPAHPGIKAEIDPILENPEGQPRFPEIPFPENFYTYRHDLFPLELVEDIQRQVRGVGEPPRHPSQASTIVGQVDTEGGKQLIQLCVTWLEAIKQWEKGNQAMKRRRYEEALAAYDACQAATLDFFSLLFLGLNVGSGSLNSRLTKLIKHLWENREQQSFLWSSIIWRRGLLSLEELRAWDFPKPGDLARLLHPRFRDPSTSIGDAPKDPDPDYGLGFIQFYFHRIVQFDLQTHLYAPLITISFVLVPLARAEANRALRQYEAVFRDLRWVLDSVVVDNIPQPPAHPTPFIQVSARLACEFIELPFARLLLAETLLEKADAEYKAQIPADPPPAPDVSAFQGLKAAQTYLAIKDEYSRSERQYVVRVDAGRDELVQQIQERAAVGDTTSRAFLVLGKTMNVPTVVSLTPVLPGMGRLANAHKPLLKFTPLPDQNTLPEKNPRVFAALLLAEARLQQLKAGFNYLGYLDSYVPPFRFQFLLERARYFAEHAKNAQRDYLNFLNNAEHEDFQEISTSQNVEMEKSNIRIETARVEQAASEVAASQQSRDLADLSAKDARKRLDAFKQFDEYADALFGINGGDLVEDASLLVNKVPGLNASLTAVGDFFTGGALSNRKQTLLADAQRNLEKLNLESAEAEADQALEVARAQLKAATDGLTVTGLQRQAALLRHEFAVQNLQFLRNRTLDTEQWYRLAASIRNISETYLRYAVELAFLAEQAYEFEADKRINVIRFDYDLSEVGNFLAADFLLRDLDTLEQDLIVTQRQREQHVRYVLSMAREFPEALQEIRDNGKATFSLRLEQLEQRFPGLYNLRIGAVDVLPVALLDSTRFSLELTHLGTSQVRLKAQPDTPPGIPSTSPLNTNDLPIAAGGWLAELQETYPIKLRVTGPETAVFSGLTRQDASAIFAFATSGQRQAFEALGAAAAWQVDFTARENQVVPGTLADLLITFTLSGYHDSELRRAIDHAPRATTATTSFISGQTTFPDALYEFNRAGRMTWDVTPDLLTLTDTLGAVRNVGVLLLPASNKANYCSRLLSHWAVRVRISKAGNLEILNELPQVTFTNGSAANPLVLTATATLSSATQISWDFGDGSARQAGASQEHTYAKPGKYTITLRMVRNSRLTELRTAVVVSRAHGDRLLSPVTAFPTLTHITSPNIPAGLTRIEGKVNTPASDPVSAAWRIGQNSVQKGNSASFDLRPGDYTLFFTAVRQLKGSIACTQRQFTEATFGFNGLSLTTNRRFNLKGEETTGRDQNPPATPFTKQLFDDSALSPADAWTLELPLADNPCMRSVSASDVEQVDLAEIQDALLVIEYETTPGSP